MGFTDQFRSWPTHCIAFASNTAVPDQLQATLRMGTGIELGRSGWNIRYIVKLSSTLNLSTDGYASASSGESPVPFGSSLYLNTLLLVESTAVDLTSCLCRIPSSVV